MRPTYKFIQLALLCVALLFAGASSGARAALPSVSGADKGDYARIVFSWPEGVPFTAKVEGKTLKVKFSKQANPNLSALKSSLGAYVDNAVMAPDGQTALITLKHSYPVRTFISDNANGIDLLQIRSKRFSKEEANTPPPAKQVAPQTAPKISPPVTAKTSQTASAKPVSAKPVPAKRLPAKALPVKALPFSKPSAPLKPAEKKLAESKSKPATAPIKSTPKPSKANAAAPATPASKEVASAAPASETPESATKTPPTETAPASASPSEALPPIALTMGAPSASSNPAKDQVAPSAAFEAPKTENPASQQAAALPPSSASTATTAALPPAAPVAAAAARKEQPTVSAQVAAPAGGRGLMVAVQKKSISADFNFPWTERVAAAGFTYGQDFWIIFSKPSQVDVLALQSVAPAFVSSISQIPSPTATFLRFTLNEELAPTVRKASNNYEWTFSLGRRSHAPESPLVAEARNEPPVKPHIFLPVLEAAQPIPLTHPVTGEEMVILPLYKGGQGIFPERDFVDASLPRTAQGVLVIKHNDQVRVAKLRNGVRIGSTEGLQIARNLPALDLKAYASEDEAGETFFPYEQWKTADATDFAAREQTLRRAITEASDPRASRLRKKLAELYMGDGQFIETLGILNLIRSTDPDYYADYQLSALRGAANFMAERIPDAIVDFSDPALDGSEEIAFWKRMTAVMNGQENKLLKYNEFNSQFAKNYPPEMRRRLVLIAADQAIGQEMYQEALAIMKSLPKEVIEPIGAYRDFMIGRMYSESGKYKEAEEMLTKLIDSTDDRFLRARASFTLATTKFKAGEIDKSELIKELDALRIVWRGDQLEISLLELLGNLYVGEKQYVEGLRAWKDLVTNYPNTALAQDISIKMSQTFLQLFKDGFAKDLSPLNALALYYEFKDLTPIGTDGDKMIQELADRLASVDLLDRAAALLEHQVMYRLEKEERSKVGTRLALIYLLDKKPEQAIQVLELTGYGNNPAELQMQRAHLAANAYAATGDWKTALSMLEGDFSRESKIIQMDIQWDNKDWPNVITLGEDMLASRTNITAPLSDDEARTLMRLAVAYAMTGDRLQLNYLRDYFSPLMAESVYKNSFDFITDDKGPIDPRNIQQLATDISKTKSFLETYRASVAENGLSSTVN